MTEFKNYWSYAVCWKGQVVLPGQTVNNNPKKIIKTSPLKKVGIKKVKKDGFME